MHLLLIPKMTSSVSILKSKSKLADSTVKFVSVLLQFSNDTRGIEQRRRNFQHKTVKFIDRHFKFVAVVAVAICNKHAGDGEDNGHLQV